MLLPLSLVSGVHPDLIPRPVTPVGTTSVSLNTFYSS